MKTRILLVVACLMVGLQIANAQEHVYNIRATQQDKIVKIIYDLKTRSEVKMLISLDDGQTYTDTMSISGHVNKIITAGRNRMITWQAFKDLGYGDYPEIRFKFITIEKKLEPTNTKGSKKSRNRYQRIDAITFITLNGGYTNTQNPSVGFTFGQVKKYGWFASVMSGFHFSGLFPAAKGDEDGFVGDDLPFYKDEYARTTLSIMGGGVMRLNEYMYAKAGLGFGNRSLTWKTLDDKWVRNKGYSAVGVDFSLGMMFKFGGFIISIDGVTTNFKIYEGRIGLGYSFINR